MEEFQVPEDVGDPSTLQVEAAGRFCASKDLPSLRDEGAGELNDRLDGVDSRLANGADCLSEQENFDEMFSFVRDFKYLPSEIKGRVLQILYGVLDRVVPALGRTGGGGGVDGRRASGQPQGQAELTLRNTVKMTVYLLFSAAFPAEECYSSAKQTAVLDKPAKGRGAGNRKGNKSSSTSSGGGAFKWEDAREEVLASMRLALGVDASRLWRQGIPDRCFMGLFLRLACKMLELPETVKSAKQSKLALELISEPFHMAQGMETEFSAAVFLLVRENKHLAGPVAKLCCDMVEKYKDARLGADLVREVGRMDMPDVTRNMASAAPVVNVSEFLRELVLVLPGTVHAHASVLLPHLSSRPYQIRNAVVFSLAEVVSAAHEERRRAAEEGGSGGAGSCPGNDGGERDSQVQMDPRCVRMKDRNRDALLDQLVERALDVSPFVRMMVLKAWAVIAERKALPRKRFLIAARLGADRLRDQSSLVRKEAAKLLATLLEYNPYNSTLNLNVNEQISKQSEAELREMSPPAPVPILAENAVEDGESEGDGPCGDGQSEGGGQDEKGDDNDTDKDDSDAEGGVDDEAQKVAEEGNDEGETPDVDEDSESSEETSELAVKVAECEHFRAAVLFIKELEVAGGRLRGMLGSTTTSDVVEALRFFVKGCHFQLPGAVEAIKKSLTLIWRTEGSIEVDTKRAFVEVFIQQASRDGAESREGLPFQMVARNLVGLVNESKAGELASLEEVVASLVKDTLDADKPTVLDPEVFEQLWCAVGNSKQSPGGRAGALHAIAMGASADPSLVSNADRLGTVLKAALGRATMESRDWHTVRCACIALLRCDPDVTGSSKEMELILSRLSLFLQGKWCRSVTRETGGEERAAAEDEMKDWFGAAEQGIAVLFHLNHAPEVLGAAIVRRIAADTLAADEASPLALSRLCFVLGHLALKLLVYSEDLAGTLERARAKVKPQRKDGSGAGSPGSSINDDDDATAQELGLNAEVSAEDEQRLAELVEKEIVGRNLLGAFGPLLVRIVADEDEVFGHPLVRQSSVLALSKFMCISGGFCDRNLSLLFTTLERATDTAVRANIVVALGDLAFRFPNALEPWNSRMYDRLKDACPRVRANAIMVLTHLILNDMVKAKGHVSGLAICVVDKEARIQDAAKVFFHKYAERGTNPIYNILPDIVGRLSVDETVSEIEFKQIMHVLMPYVKKDKLTEMLAEKLCVRLAACDPDQPRQSRSVSYCLGQLKVTEKAVRRLSELVPTYKLQLRDKDVFANFMTLTKQAKMFAGREVEQAVDEWKTQLEQFHNGGADDEDAAARAVKAGLKRADNRASTTPSVGAVGGQGKKAAEETSQRAKTGKTPARSRARNAKKPLPESEESESEDEHGDEASEEETEEDSVEDDHEEEEEEEDDVFEKKTNKRAASRGRRKKASEGRTSRATAEEEEAVVENKRAKRHPAKNTSKRHAVAPLSVRVDAEDEGEDEEAQWESDNEATRKAATTKTRRIPASKENRVNGKVTPAQRSRRARNASPLSPAN